MGSPETTPLEKGRAHAGRPAFTEELRAANPAGAELLDRNRAKANIAMSLRKLRKARRMTQEDVSEASGLSQPMISRMESPLGAMPTLDSIMRYATACDAHVALGFRFDERAEPEPAQTEWIMPSNQEEDSTSQYRFAKLV